MVQECSDNRLEEMELEMASAQGVVARTIIILGMVAATVTIVYLTPMPDHNFKSCDRPCHDLDWPMICRLKLLIEEPLKVNGICEHCRDNSSHHCTEEYCLSEDFSKRLIVANRQLPGPPIQVCQNDVVVVDLINKIPGQSLTVHWRGQPNHEAPFMDGVPMVTQCPVPSFTTFQYKFRASSPGTHFYHAYSDEERSDGLFGALIVRQPDKVDPHRKLYDIDDKDHIILISEWGDKTKNPIAILANGKSGAKGFAPLAEFFVSSGKKYRFRVGHTGGYRGCPVKMSVDNHVLKVIALDGTPIKPYEASSVTLGKGERLDFVLKASQEPKGYFIKLRSECEGNVIEGKALITYDLKNGKISNEKPVIEKTSGSRNLDTALCDSEIGKVCLEDVKSLTKMPEDLREFANGKVIHLAFGSKTIDLNGNFRSKVYVVNNLTFTYPSSPLLTQLREVPIESTCDQVNVPEKCEKTPNLCQCVHVENIPLGSPTELILIDQGAAEGNEEHVFHLHGHHFYVVGSRQFHHPLSMGEIKLLDEQEKLFKRNLNNPILKDTIRVPRNGVVALRFMANNPGFWMLRDEKSKGWTRGMDVVFQVGDITDLPSNPSKFPKCGDFVGPDFFFI